MKVKRMIYKTGLNFRRHFWKLSGGRQIKAFGERFCVAPDTIFPTYRKFPLPKGDCLSEIVRFTDFVQLHSVCNLVMRLEKPVILDIGAHHGAYAIILGKFAQRKGGKVLAIEPNPESFNLLKDNVRLNDLEDTVFCEQIAVLGKSGLANFDPCGGESHVTEKDTGYTVKARTVKELLNKYEIKSMDILIIDVEGAEIDILLDFPLESIKIERIYCELHPYAWKDFSHSAEVVRDFLRSHNFRCFDMYLQEYTSFEENRYIGPVVFIPDLMSVKMVQTGKQLL